MKKLLMHTLLIMSGSYVFGFEHGTNTSVSINDMQEQIGVVKDALLQGIRTNPSAWLKEEYVHLVQELEAMQRALGSTPAEVRAKVDAILQENPQYSYITLDNSSLESWLSRIKHGLPWENNK